MGCGVRKVVQGLPMRTMFLIACMYTILYGLKGLGQYLPSIDELRKSHNRWTIEPLKTPATAYVIDGVLRSVIEGFALQRSFRRFWP